MAGTGVALRANIVTSGLICSCRGNLLTWALLCRAGCVLHDAMAKSFLLRKHFRHEFSRSKSSSSTVFIVTFYELVRISFREL